MRVELWDVKLARWASSRLGAPFEWGVVDCWQLACEAVDVMCGTDAASVYRGRYTDAVSALRLARAEDTDLARFLARYSAVEVTVGFQQRGDILVVEQDGFKCGHVCFGARSLSCGPGEGVVWCATREVMAKGAAVLRV